MDWFLSQIQWLDQGFLIWIQLQILTCSMHIMHAINDGGLQFELNWERGI